MSALVGRLVGAVALAVALGAWTAFVLWKQYGWFVVPLGAPALSWWHVWGLTGVVGLLALPFMRLRNDKDSPGFSDIIVAALTKALIVLLSLIVGWVISGQVTP